MKIKTPLVLEEGKIIYPTGKSWWSGAVKEGIYLVGDFSGDLYDQEGNKTFNWEEWFETEPHPTKITVLAYRRRFIDEEKAMLDFLSLDNPNATTEERLMAAGVRQMFEDLSTASFVDLTDPYIKAATTKACKLLNVAGVCDNPQQRTMEILETPPTQLELPE